MNITNPDSQYLNILKKVLDNGEEKIGRNGLTKSLFSESLTFDLRDGFPLLTTKKMFIRGIIEELLFFLRGDTDSSILEEKKINIWKGNTNRKFLDSIGKNKRKTGVLGPMYGYQWRNFNAPYNEETHSAVDKNLGIDQLSNLIDKIKKDPSSRRLVITDFNPSQADEGVLYPCHSLILQFYVSGNYIDMFCYNRSSDLFHGLPFNIASSSLLLMIIAKVTNLVPRKFNLTLGDCHIYESHYDSVKTQLNRIPYNFPQININKELKTISDIEKLEFTDFSIENYKYHPSIKVDMVS